MSKAPGTKVIFMPYNASTEGYSGAPGPSGSNGGFKLDPMSATVHQMIADQA